MLSVRDPGGGEGAPLPKQYKDLAGVFLEGDASLLPDYGPHELSIDIIKGKSPPFGPLYNLSENKL